MASLFVQAPAAPLSAQADTRLVSFHDNESDYLVKPLPTGDYALLRSDSGKILHHGPDAGRVVNFAIGMVAASGGGQVFLKAGDYAITEPILVDNRDRITILGTDRTVLVSAGTAIRIDGGSDSITIQRMTFQGGGGKGINLLWGSNVRIQDCRFIDLPAPAIQVRIGDDPNAPVDNLWIDGCFAVGCGGSQPAFHIYRTRGLFLTRNLVERSPGTGINVQVYSQRVVCADNIVRECGGHGIYIGANEGRVSIRGNIVTGCTFNGIEAASGGGAGEPRGAMFIVSENHCIGNGTGGTGATHNGIYVTGSNLIASGNVCRNNGGAGIQVGFSDDASNLVVEGNVVTDNNVAGNTGKLWASGLSVTGPRLGGAGPAQQWLVLRDNLICQHDPGGQTRAIYCAPGSNGIVVEGNRVSGPSQPLIEWSPTAMDVLVRHNHGFRTGASGLSSTASSGTAGFVDVDLATHLDVDDVVVLSASRFSISPASSLGGSSGQLWAEHAGGTVFRVHWSSGAPTSGLSFQWRYAEP